MADVKISALSAVTDLQDTDILPLVRSTANNKITGANLKAQVIAAATNATQAELDTHEADTTSVHGIANTANLYAAGGTDVAVADGGTGASSASAARTNLGLVIDTDVPSQASVVLKSLYDAQTVLAAISDNTPAAITMGASTTLARLASGDIVAATVAQMAALLAPALPAYQLSYVPITTSAASTQTVQASATTILTAASITFDGSTPVMIHVFSERLSQSVVSSALINIWEDSTDLSTIGRNSASAGTLGGPFNGWLKITPAAGAKVYTARLWISSAGTATALAGAGTGGGSAPAYIRIFRA